eukprot:13283041-Alexandrium_andersonii.AAC.1
MMAARSRSSSPSSSAPIGMAAPGGRPSQPAGALWEQRWMCPAAGESMGIPSVACHSAGSPAPLLDPSG